MLEGQEVSLCCRGTDLHTVRHLPVVEKAARRVWWVLRSRMDIDCEQILAHEAGSFLLTPERC